MKYLICGQGDCSCESEYALIDDTIPADDSQLSVYLHTDINCSMYAVPVLYRLYRCGWSYYLQRALNFDHSPPGPRCPGPKRDARFGGLSTKYTKIPVCLTER